MSDDKDLPCCCGEPASFTIQFGDEPPIFVVNTGLLEAIDSQWRGEGPLLRVVDPATGHDLA